MKLKEKQKFKTTNHMKTKTIIFGVVIAAISIFTITNTKAQGQEPAIKVVPGAQPDMIKVLYGYDTDKLVEVRFTNADGIIKTDRISGKDFKGGFLKKYDVENMKGSSFWVEVESPELSVTYKMTAAKNGKWSAQLEKTTYNYTIVAVK
jgi:hypothetical protein